MAPVRHGCHVLPADRRQFAYNLLHVLGQVPERLMVALVFAVLAAAAAADHLCQLADALGSEDDVGVLFVLVHRPPFALLLLHFAQLAVDAAGLVYPAMTVATRVCHRVLPAGFHSAAVLHHAVHHLRALQASAAVAFVHRSVAAAH